jgi:hypothetical protein
MSDNNHNQSSLARSSNALQQLAAYVHHVTVEAAARTMGNLRLEAIRNEATLTERFLAYLEMGLDRQYVDADEPLRVSAIAFTDRGVDGDSFERETGADMACFIRYDLPGLRWAKGFLGQSKMAEVTGIQDDGTVQIGLKSEADYDQMIRDCTAMRAITEESFVFFFSPESVTVEKASALLGDLGEMYPEKPWRDIHQFRTDKGVNIARFYGAFAACQLGDILLDRPAIGFDSVLDLINAQGIAVVLLIMVGTVTPMPSLQPDSAELAALPFEVPQTYWQWPALMATLMQGRQIE